MKMIVKIHNVNGKKILAICDENIFGRVYMDKDVQLDLSSAFYNGSNISQKELIKLVRNCYSINAVGNKSIRFLIKIGVISRNKIGKVKNVPYAFAILE